MAAAARAAVVLSYHADVVRQATIMRYYMPVAVAVLRWVNAIVIGSPPMRRSALLAEHQAKLNLIPYGIPLARFRAEPPEADRARLRARIAALFPCSDPTPATQAADTSTPPSLRSSAPPPGLLRAPAPLLLFVGRLRYYKGLDTLIRALPQIDARLLIVGTGPMEAEWRAVAAEAGVAGRIAWLGEAPDADLPALYHLADLFVLPASHPSEAFGLVQVEAMAAGLPVVCTELGTGTSYVNQNGVTGLVVPPRDPQAMAEAVNVLLADPPRRAALGAAARLRVAAEFDLDVMVERVVALYGTTLRVRRRTSEE